MMMVTGQRRGSERQGDGSEHKYPDNDHCFITPRSRPGILQNRAREVNAGVQNERAAF
jgi:hypothetical protein